MNRSSSQLLRSFGIFGALSLAVLGASFACGGGAPASSGEDCIGPSCQQTDLCHALYEDECGKACDDTSDCAAGLYCGADEKCTADCARSSADSCGADAECAEDGRCRSSVNGGGPIIGIGGDLNGGAGGDNGTCIDVNVAFEPQIPTVILLVDQSGSMNASDGWNVPNDYEPWDCPSNGTWRWNVVRNILFNPDSGVVKPLEDKVRFGLSLYTSFDGSLDGGTCPLLEKVGIALNNHAAMLDQFECSDIKDDTPTAASLDDAVADIEAFDEPGPKIVILATDGEPDTCECPDFSGNAVPEECRGPNAAAKQQEAKEGVVASAAAAQSKDITVHVINVSTPSNAALHAHLVDVAEAGGGNLYPGFNPDELRHAFQEIIDGVRSCVLDLGGEIASGKASSGVVRLNDDSLVLDDANGWRVNSASQIELLGTACEHIKSGNHHLSIRFPCGSFIVR